MSEKQQRRDNIAAIIGAALLSEAYKHTAYPKWESVIQNTVIFTDQLLAKLDETYRDE